MFWVCMLLALTALLTALSASPSPGPADPIVIYKAAMQRLASLPQPDYIDDTEHWSTVMFAGGQEVPEEHFERIVFNAVTRRECVTAVPFDPKGLLIIGDSYFAPDTWLIHRRAPAAPANVSAPNMSPDLSDLKVIANVVSVAKPSYDIKLLGTDPLSGGGSAYHIALRPLFDPAKHNLRELWIDTSTYDIRRAVIQGEYRPVPSALLQQTYVQEDFGNVGGYWLVIHHVWTYADPFSGTKYQYNATSVQMRFPPAVPSWLFDEREFRAHEGEVPQALP